MVHEPDNSVSLSDIGTELAISGEPSLMAQKEQRQMELEHTRENNRHDAESENRRLGFLGRFFGSRDNALVYVVAFLILVCAAAVAFLGFQDSALRANAFEFFKTVAIALVGFFIGRAVPDKDQ
jgi:hypothetical protein